MCEDAPRLMYDVATAARQLSVGRSTLYELLRRGELASCLIGTRRLLAHDDLVAFVRAHRADHTERGPAC